MALAHQLVVITRENPEENVWLDTERVFLSNLLFQYMKDSLMWVNTRWNGKKLTTGFGVLPVKRTMKNNKFFSVSLLTGWRYFYAAFNVSS